MPRGVGRDAGRRVLARVGAARVEDRPQQVRGELVDVRGPSPFVGPNVNVCTSVVVGAICSVTVSPTLNAAFAGKNLKTVAPTRGRCPPGSRSAGSALPGAEALDLAERFGELDLRGPLVLLGDGMSLPSPTTLTCPTMPGCTVHRYVNVPVFGNFRV